MRSTPWSAFLAAALFGVGLALWIAGAVKIQDYTYQVGGGACVCVCLDGSKCCVRFGSCPTPPLATLLNQPPLPTPPSLTQTHQHNQVARAIDVAPNVTDALKAGLISVILAVGVSGIIVAVLVLMLALFGTGLRTALVSKTCLNNSELLAGWLVSLGVG